MTIGQLCFYDQVKLTLLATPYFSDNLVTHFTSSLAAVSFYLKYHVKMRDLFPNYHVKRWKFSPLIITSNVGSFYPNYHVKMRVFLPYLLCEYALL